MSYRNKTYVAFDGDNDIKYYLLMKAWKKTDGSAFNFYDAHDINSARDYSQEQSIKKQLRIRMENSKVFVLLIGEKTRYLRKFVKWEIETAIKLGLPIIAVNLNGSKFKDNFCPPSLEGQLTIFVPYGKRIIQYALENWPYSHTLYKNAGEIGAYYYKDNVYEKLYQNL